jgi:cysteine desulfurase
MLGGGQERGLRPGTEATMLAAAFAAALASAEEVRPKFAERASAARTRLLAQIAEAIPDALENRGYLQVPHILNISFPGRDTDYLAALLDEAGFAVSTRSACETDEPGSRAVLAFTGDGARAASALRISWGPQTATRDLDRLALALIRAVRFLDANAV